MSAKETLSLLQRVDEACLRFEDRWRSGQRPRLEAQLAEFDPGDEALNKVLFEYIYHAGARSGSTSGKTAFSEPPAPAPGAQARPFRFPAMPPMPGGVAAPMERPKQGLRANEWNDVEIVPG